MNKAYDIVIIGAGPAGLTAGLYAARARMDALLLSKAIPGGQTMLTSEIENYPGFKDVITGPKLMQDMLEQAKKYELKLSSEEVVNIEK